MPRETQLTQPRIWVISDGRRGIENQALGLAEAMAGLRPAQITSHQIQNTGLFRALPARLQKTLKGRPEQFGLIGDMPDIAIGCGRQAIASLLAIKNTSPNCFTAYIQNPRIHLPCFDLVIAPEHDELTGQNVVSMIGSPNRISLEKLAESHTHFAAKFAYLPAPRAALLIGGKSKAHRLSQACLNIHMRAAQALLENNCSLMISTSRRTPDFARRAWQAFAKDNSSVWLFDNTQHGSGPNPYFPFLNAADIILVTQDSTNMLTEACATGKPVFTLLMRGKNRKFEKLYAALETRCGVVPWAGQLTGERYAPLAETGRVAKIAWLKFDAKILE